MPRLFAWVFRMLLAIIIDKVVLSGKFYVFNLPQTHAREVASIFISCIRQAEYNFQFMFSSREEKLKFVENHRKRSEHNCVDVGYHFVINSHPTKHCVTTRNLWLAAFSRQRKQNLEIFLPQGRKRN